MPRRQLVEVQMLMQEKKVAVQRKEKRKSRKIVSDIRPVHRAATVAIQVIRAVVIPQVQVNRHLHQVKFLSLAFSMHIHVLFKIYARYHQHHK